MSTYSNILVISFFMALSIALVLIPNLIRLANSKQWFDQPDERKQHVDQISSLGGLAILVGTLVSLFLFTDWRSNHSLMYLCIASIFLGAVGFIDDLNGMKAPRKLTFQLICGAIIFAGGWSVGSMLSFVLEVNLPLLIDFSLTLFFIATLINAFNFIDGIDGLAGTLGVINAIVFGTIFLMNGQSMMAILALSLAGSCLGFLRFNFHNAKLFMGDCGSMFLGLMTAVMCMHAFQFDILSGSVSPMLAISFWLLPVFDLMRVSFSRILRSKSPFNADRTHVHHVLLKAGLPTMVACLSLGCLHFVHTALVYYFGMLGIFASGITYLVFIIGFQYHGQAKPKPFSESVLTSV